MRFAAVVSALLLCVGEAAYADTPPILLNTWRLCGSGPQQPPSNLCTDNLGNILVADNEAHPSRIRKFDSSGGVLADYSLLGYGTLGDLAVGPDGSIYSIVDLGYVQVRSSSGEFLFAFGGGQFTDANGIAVATDGTILVCDGRQDRIQAFRVDGTFLRAFGTQGSGDGQLNYPVGVAVDGQGNVFVADNDNHRVDKFAIDGAFLTSWAPSTSDGSTFAYPLAIAVDAQGNVYVVTDHRAQKFTGSGALLTEWLIDGAPVDIAADASGNVYILDSANCRVMRYGQPPVPVIAKTWGHVKDRYRK